MSKHKAGAKVTYVELECPTGKRKFEISHAERLLQMRGNGGWQLPKESKFEFDLKNGIKFRTNKETSIGTQEKGGDK